MNPGKLRQALDADGSEVGDTQVPVDPVGQDDDDGPPGHPFSLRTASVSFYLQHNLADMRRCRHQLMGFSYLGQRKRGMDDGPNLSRLKERPDLLQ